MSMDPVDLPEPKSLELLTSPMVYALITALGLGALGIDFSGIDCTFGRGVLGGLDKCIWNGKGQRISIEIIQGEGMIVWQTQKPDPYYIEAKAA